MSWISNHKHKIEEKSTKSSQSSFKVVGLGPPPCGNFQHWVQVQQCLSTTSTKYEYHSPAYKPHSQLIRLCTGHLWWVESPINMSYSDTIWHNRFGSSFVQVMACCLYNAKPLPEPMVPTHLGRPKIRTFPGPFQDLGQINKDLQLTYDS